jgi:hypothetical protein
VWLRTPNELQMAAFVYAPALLCTFHASTPVISRFGLCLDLLLELLVIELEHLSQGVKQLTRPYNDTSVDVGAPPPETLEWGPTYPNHTHHDSMDCSVILLAWDAQGILL